MEKWIESQVSLPKLEMETVSKSYSKSAYFKSRDPFTVQSALKSSFIIIIIIICKRKKAVKLAALL